MSELRDGLEPFEGQLDLPSQSVCFQHLAGGGLFRVERSED